VRQNYSVTHAKTHETKLWAGADACSVRQQHGCTNP